MKNLLEVSLYFIMLSILAASISYSSNTISSCQTINVSGFYNLTQDIGISGNCLTILSDNVSLDCKGYTLSGSDTGYGIYSYGSFGDEFTNILFILMRIYIS